MIMEHDQTEILSRKIRALVEKSRGANAVTALWRVALIFTIRRYGAIVTASALRDLADEIEADLFRGPMQ